METSAPEIIKRETRTFLLTYAGLLVVGAVVTFYVALTSSASSIPPNTKTFVLMIGGFALGFGLWSLVSYLLEARASNNIVLLGIRRKQIFGILIVIPIPLIIGVAMLYLDSVGAFGTGRLPLVMLIIGAIVTLLFLFLLVRAIINYFIPRLNGIYTTLKLYGDPQQVIDSIDAEMRAKPTQHNVTYLTKGWIVYTRANNFKILSFDEVVWVYATFFSVRINSSTRRSDAAVVFTNYGRRIEFEQDRSSIQALVQDIAAHAPWSIGGYDTKLVDKWKANKEEIIAQVEQRREALMGSTRN